MQKYNTLPLGHYWIRGIDSDRNHFECRLCNQIIFIYQHGNFISDSYWYTKSGEIIRCSEQRNLNRMNEALE